MSGVPGAAAMPANLQYGSLPQQQPFTPPPQQQLNQMAMQQFTSTIAAAAAPQIENNGQYTKVRSYSFNR